MTFSLKRNEYLQIFQSITHNHCPVCASNLHFDDQNDSVYISCDNSLEHFEFSGFKDLGSGELVLVYLNNNFEGIVNTEILKDFQNIIYRKLYNSVKK